MTATPDHMFTLPISIPPTELHRRWVWPDGTTDEKPLCGVRRPDPLTGPGNATDAAQGILGALEGKP